MNEEKIINSAILGYDCDGTALFEFDIVRAIWYSEIDFNIETTIDPRQYCVVKASNGRSYLISVYDWWNKKAINKYERRPLEEIVPIKIRTIEEAINYEKAYSDNYEFTYTLDRKKLIKTLNKNLQK